MSEYDYDALSHKKNGLIIELHHILHELETGKVDMLCDKQLREAISNHIVLDMNIFKSQFDKE